MYVCRKKYRMGTGAIAIPLRKWSSCVLLGCIGHYRIHHNRLEVEMDRTTLTNFNNIRSEIIRIRVRNLINTLHANQGLYEVESIGTEMNWLQIEIKEASQRRLKKLTRITPQDTEGKEDDKENE